MQVRLDTTANRLGIMQSSKRNKSLLRRLFPKSHKQVIRYSLLAANLVILIGVIGFIVYGSQKGGSVKQSALAANKSNSVAANPLDELSSADIAVHVARMTRLDEMPAVTSNAISVNAQLDIRPADEQVIAKPQIITTTLKSKSDVKKYTTKSGDTISALATRYGVTSDTIRWSNGLGASDSLPAGKELVISPINGIVHTVKAGDTVDSLAQKYGANKDQIVAFNDAEVGGLKVGDRVVIPDGVLVPVRASRSSYTGGFAWGGYSPVYGGNGYDYGYCTWWAAVRRSQVGKPIPSNLGNASTWKTLAQRAGLAVGNKPAKHAVIWTPPRDYYGHVGFVEEVNPDGSVLVSEMNVAGWGKVSRKTLSPAQAAGYSYIY